jgi:hypothetical protein
MDFLFDTTAMYDGLANLVAFSPGDDSAKTPAKPPAAKASAAGASAAATPGAQQPLPPGWKKHRSRQTGEAYYRNREKGLLQWARPVCEEGDGGDPAPAHGGEGQHGARDDDAGRKLRAAEPESKETVTQKVAHGCTAFGSNAEFVMSSKSTQVASCTSNASADGGDVQCANRAEIEIDEEYQIAALTHRLIEKVRHVSPSPTSNHPSSSSPKWLLQQPGRGEPRGIQTRGALCGEMAPGCFTAWRGNKSRASDRSGSKRTRAR